MPDVFDTIDATAPAPDAKGDVFDSLGPEDLPSREAFEASHHAAVKSFWERTKDAAGAVADIGAAGGSMVLKKAEQMTSAPLVSAGDVGAAVSGALGFGEKAGRDITAGQPNTIAGALGAQPPPGAPQIPMTASGIPQTVPGSIGKGGAELVSGLTSPQNISLAALMGPVGKIAPLLSRAVSAGFGVQMLKSVYDQSPEVQDAIAKKDWPRAAEAITKAAGTGLLGVAAGLHAAGVGAPPEAARIAEPSPIEKATASARAGVEALTPEGQPDVFDQTDPNASAALPAGDVFDQVAQTGQSTAAAPDVFDQVAPSASRAMSAGAAGTPDVFDQLGSASVPPKPLWEMSPNELDTAAAEAKGRDQADLQDLFGPDGAKQYTRLERAANSTLKSQQETAAASGQLEQMEAGLTQEQRNRLYGIGDDRPQLDDIRSYQQALGRVDTSSPEALGESLKWAVTGVGDKDNPAEMTPDEQLRYAQLRHGMTAASAQGWDPVEVSQAAFRGAAGRFQSPEDAAFMLRRFLPPEQPPSGPEMSLTYQPNAAEPGAAAEEGPKLTSSARQAATPPAYGRETIVKVPGETTTYPARYAVRELADVQPSHNAFHFAENPAFDYINDRDYDRPQNKARVVKNASPGVYDPDFTTTESPTAEHGAPVIDGSGNVLGGNSRSMTQTLVYSYKGVDAKMYRDAIAAKAAQFGIDPAELARFKKPILVREVADGLDAQRAITDFNKAAPADLAPEEQAVSDGRRLSQGTVTELAARIGDVGEEGSLADALRGDNGADILQHLVRDGVLTEQEKGGYLDDRGFLTPEIKQRIAKALVGRLFDNPSEFRSTTPSMRGKLERVAPQVLRTEARPDWAITDQLREALALTEDAKARRNSLDRHLKQTAAAGARTYSPEAVDLARTLEESPVKAGAAFRRYANDEALSREGNQTAFFKPPTRMEAFADAFKIPNLADRISGTPAAERGSAPMLTDLAQLGAHYLRRGVEAFSDWSKRMVEAVGDWVRPYLARAFVAARKVLGDERGSWSNKPEDQSGSLFGSEDDQRTARESAADRDKLQGQRLTAQFEAPLSREEQLRKLRAGQKPPQTNLFEATPDRPQFSLFGPDHPERQPGDPAIVDSPDQQRIRNSIREGEMRLESGRDSQGKKVSPEQLGAIARSVENSKARLAEQVKADSAKYGGERGGIRPDLLSLGADKFVREDIIPAAKRLASDLVEAKDEAARLVAPQTRGAAAEYTGLSLRQRMSQFSRRYDQAEQRLHDARQFFKTRTPEENYSFIDNVERGLGRGQKPGDAELEPIARMFSRMLDQRRQEVQALGEGALKGFYQNYFPHIFERPEQATSFVDSFFSGKRNMEGPKSFLKHRDYPTFREALDAGLKPVSDNPVDLVMLKAREIDRYLLAHSALRDLAENGFAKRVSGLGPDARQREMLGGAPIRPEWGVEKTTDLPPNFKSIRDPVGGGKWYAQEGAAQVLNNFLSPGLRTRSGLFRTMLGVNNTMNQANLGLSAFHLRAETISSVAGRMGLGFVKAMEGHPLDAAWHVFTSPAAPFLDYMKGSKMLHDWFKPGSEGAPIAAMVDAFMKGGGRAGQPSEYTNQIGEKMMAAFRRGNYIGGAIRSPFAAIEAMSKPLMQHLVPRMKMGAFADIAQYEMEKLGPGAKVEDVRRVMARAWDHVENRLGEMTHDNLFWNRTFKDIMQLVVRSVGWNLGSLKEVASAARVFTQLARGNRPPDLHGLGFVAGYAFTAAAMGAMMQYLHTGQGPQELKDYFWPKREDGRRMVSAPYIKDAYQMVRDPVGTLVHKTGPLFNTLGEMITNKDYYDRPIRNLDDPVVKQLQQEAEFVGRQFLPFTLQPYFGNSTKHPKPMPGGNTPEHKAENFLGVTPAPAPLQPGYKPRRLVHR